MRLVGLILSLAAITWVLYQVSGGDNAETVIPQGHQDALIKAQGVEQTVMDAAQRQREALEEQEY